MAKRSLQTTQKDVVNCDHLPQLSVESRILTIRDVQVILDRDLAELYGVQTARLNEQVKHNARRFPEAFRFQLNQQETDELIANCDRFKTLKHSSFCPYAFTEQGVAMLSAVLHSDTAVDISIRIMNAFVAMPSLNYPDFEPDNAKTLSLICNVQSAQKMCRQTTTNISVF